MKGLFRTVTALLTVLGLLCLLSPLAPALAADQAERWELEMVRAEYSALNELLGHGVRIAVIDSGITALPSLPSLEAGRDYTGEGSTEDSLGHGTFIAGLIAGNDPEYPFRGIAPGAALVPLRCFTDKDGKIEYVVKAIYDAVDEFDCDVISLSFGQHEDAEELREAVAYAAAKGAVVVAAAGNSGGSSLYYPAAYEGVIGVSSVDSSGRIARDAQHNDSVDLSAPGVRVTGPMPEGGYSVRSGSSFAVPYVAGAAAVLLSADRSLTASEIQDVLFRTASDQGEPGWDEYYGWGVLDLEAALREVLLAKEIPAFSDVSDDAWFAEAVRQTAASGLMVGLPDGRFDPMGQVTRGMFVTVLYRAAGSPTAGETGPFSDVEDGAWYAPAANWAAEAGLVYGVSSDCFAPELILTREAMAVILQRMGAGVGREPSGTLIDSFTDAGRISPWAFEGMEYCVSTGLLRGVSETELSPKGTLTRAELAVLLSRLAE